MSYGIKYASSFFCPFRDAADSAPSLVTERLTNGPTNRLEAFRELESDLKRLNDDSKTCAKLFRYCKRR